MNKQNIFENIIIDNNKEEFIDLVKNENIRIERIVSNGQKSEEDFWYEQEENEFVMVLDGDAVIEFEEEEIILQKGDYLNILANRKHRVKYTNKDKATVWLAVFYK